MSSANPLPRSARRNDVDATIGQVAFGPFDWKIYAVEDVAVSTRPAADDFYTPVDVADYTVALQSASLPAFFTVTFASAPRASGDALSVRIAGARIDERGTDVTQAGVVRSVPLEAEFDRKTVVLQELRRDVDDALAPGALTLAASAAAAQGTAIATAAATAAQAALADATTLTDNLQQSVDSTLDQVNDVLAAATLAKNDAVAAAATTTADRAATGDDVTACTGLVAAAQGYAAALANPDYGFVADAPSETRDYGAVAT